MTERECLGENRTRQYRASTEEFPDFFLIFNTDIRPSILLLMQIGLEA
jgi:hypothetical protein